MIGITEIIVFILFILLIIFFIFYSVKMIKRNKNVLRNLKPLRSLDKNDIQSLQFLEIDGNLSVNPIPLKRLPKRKTYKDVWQFTNCTFTITSMRIGKRSMSVFYININGETVRVIIPDIFSSYIKQGATYENKNIEILYRLDSFVLFDIEGVIGYNSLYKKIK